MALVVIRSGGTNEMNDDPRIILMRLGGHGSPFQHDASVSAALLDSTSDYTVRAHGLSHHVTRSGEVVAKREDQSSGPGGRLARANASAAAGDAIPLSNQGSRIRITITLRIDL